MDWSSSSARAKSVLYLFVTGGLDNMSTTKSMKKWPKGENSWDQAIADAKALLLRVEEKAIRVRVAIKSFEQSKRDGELYQSGTPKRAV